jgi:A/G-specific adenine glycosylase
MICPWTQSCAGRIAGIAGSLPRKSPKKAKPTRLGTAFWCLNQDRDVFLRRRPSTGLLGGMMEIPSSEWREDAALGEFEADDPPFKTDWRELPGVVRHTFTHFHLELRVLAGRMNGIGDQAPGVWHPIADLDRAGLPSVMVKIARHALKHG